MNLLRRFWFSFKDPPDFNPLNIGCGVTAYDVDDAINILNLCVFPMSGVLVIESVEENIDVQRLDKHHVMPNIGLVSSRGVWFPLGYLTI